jgi:hypothetical protein
VQKKNLGGVKSGRLRRSAAGRSRTGTGSGDRGQVAAETAEEMDRVAADQAFSHSAENTATQVTILRNFSSGKQLTDKFLSQTNGQNFIQNQHINLHLKITDNINIF